MGERTTGPWQYQPLPDPGGWIAISAIHWGLVREKKSGSGSLGSQGLLHLTRFEDLLLNLLLNNNTDSRLTCQVLTPG